MARRLIRIGAQLAQALAVAHAAGIVHRDIKPENVMLRADGYIKVLDFGLARLTARPASVDPSATHPSLILGTPRYMSPEQARGETATAASDVFSLGVLLYELATGVHPFESASTLGFLHAITTQPPPSPLRWMPGLAPALERLLLSMLAKEPAARPTAAEAEASLTMLPAPAATPLPWERQVHPPPPARNLPPQRAALLGRTAELTAVKERLLHEAARLLTLTGSGGTGKTRLAIQVAEDLADRFEGGVWFANLAPVADPRRVASAVAGALGLRESGDLPLVQSIAAHLRTRGATLLLIDNFEQVSAAADVVKDLLDLCPLLKVLVTSRVALRIYGEQEFPVRPLALPADVEGLAPAALLENAAVALFVQRAAAVKPDFTLTAKNAAAVAEICRRLDGLPLAIELAAARVKILPPADLLGRFERPLELLTGGARDLPERQQTLRQTITWSYDLLTAPEQKLFRRLSVFAGGCTLEAIEAVCDTGEDLGVDVLEGVTALVDNSLLVQRLAEDIAPRFVMLETFREYGRERLAEHGEVAATERARAAYMLVIAEEENLEMRPVQREAWLRTCDAEHDNSRAALQWLIATGDAEWAMRLAGALFRFWEQRDHLTEGRETLASVLALPGAAAPTRLRARALYSAAVLADIQADPDAADQLSRAACAIYRQFADIQGVATTMIVMAFQAQRRGRYDDAVSLFSETAALWEQLGDPTAVDLAVSNTANAAKAGGDFALARRLLERVVASSQSRGDVRSFASALNALGDVAAVQGDHAAARRYHHDSLAKYRAIDDRWGIARVLSDLAAVDLQVGEYVEAESSLREAIRAFRDLGHQRGVARQLESLAWCAGCQARDDVAVMLASAAAAIRQRVGAPARRRERETIERTLTRARQQLSPEAYAAAWRNGAGAPLDRLLASAGGRDESPE